LKLAGRVQSRNLIAMRRGDSAEAARRAARSGQIEVEQESLATRLRKQRAKQEPLGEWQRVGIGALAAAIGVVLLATVFRPQQPHEHPSYQEALRVLRNDDLEATDRNVRFALQLIDIATTPFAERPERGFQTVDSREWMPQCAATGASRVCRRHPPILDVKSDESGFNMSLTELESSNARIWLIENFVTEEERSKLLQRVAEMNFSTSSTNHADGQSWRTSASAMSAKDDPAFALVQQRAAALCGVPASFVEATQAVRYEAGERYNPHMDSEGADHRHWTVLLYLSDSGDGGYTSFPLLKTKVRPTPGAAVFWENLRAEPEPAGERLVRNYYTLHESQPHAGEVPKVALNLWVRNAKYTEGL